MTAFSGPAIVRNLDVTIAPSTTMDVDVLGVSDFCKDC